MIVDCYISMEKADAEVILHFQDLSISFDPGFLHARLITCFI